MEERTFTVKFTVKLAPDFLLEKELISIKINGAHAGEIITLNEENAKKALEKFPFDAAWILYERKGSRRLSEDRWKKLSDTIREKAMSHIPRYKFANPDMRYRKDFERYLSHETYESAIPGQLSIPAPEQKPKANWIEGVHFYIDNDGRERII